MTTTMYNGSRGAVAINTMAYTHAKNALAKLQRDEPGRTEEIAALGEHVAHLEANPPEADRTPGSNNPPVEDVAAAPGCTGPMSWDALRIHMDDLLTEASNWADGIAITTAAQADEVGALLNGLKDADKLADAARQAEQAGLKKQVDAIQARYNEYIAPMKNRAPGRVSIAISALGNTLSAWLRKLEDERRQREAVAREAAARAEEEARAAHREASGSGDMAAIEEAADLMAASEDAARDLRAVERERAQVRTEGHRAFGLRKSYVAVPIEGAAGKALVHFAKRYPDRMKEFLQQLANEDVRAGQREIPGFEVLEERHV